MLQETECEAKLPVVVKRGHEPVMIPAHVEDGDGALARHGDLVGVREDLTKGGEVLKLMAFNEPLPDGKGLSGVGIVPGPFAES